MTIIFVTTAFLALTARFLKRAEHASRTVHNR